MVAPISLVFGMIVDHMLATVLTSAVSVKVKEVSKPSAAPAGKLPSQISTIANQQVCPTTAKMFV